MDIDNPFSIIMIWLKISHSFDSEFVLYIIEDAQLILDTILSYEHMVFVHFTLVGDFNASLNLY